MKRFSILALISIVFLSGCTKYKDIKIESINLSSMKIVNTSKANLVFDVKAENPTNATLYLTDMHGTLLRNNKDFATLQLMDTPSIEPSYKGAFPVKMEISIIDPISILSLGLNFKSWNVEDFRINGKITIKSSTGGRKSFKYKDVPVQRLINTFK